MGTELYDDLGVPIDATPDQIQAAFRALSKQHHPDAGGDHDTFARISAAYSVLSNEQKRIAYDAGVDPNFDPVKTATGHIRAAFTELINGSKDPDRCDLVAEVGKMIAADRKNLEKSNAAAEKQLKRIDKIEKRLKGKGLLREVLDAQRMAVEQHQAGNKASAAVMDEMERQIAGWEYDNEEAESGVVWTAMSFGSTGTT